MVEGFTNGKSHSQYLQNMLQGGSSDTISRATSPGLGFGANGIDTDREKRYRPRTFPYFKLLPYKVEEETERNVALAEIIKQLYIALKAEDIAPGAVHWTRELRAWLSLKFDITRALRVKLVKLYYMLSLAPGLDLSNGERFESMFRFLLTRYVGPSSLFCTTNDELEKSITSNPEQILFLIGARFGEKLKVSFFPMKWQRIRVAESEATRTLRVLQLMHRSFSILVKEKLCSRRFYHILAPRIVHTHSLPLGR